MYNLYKEDCASTSKPATKQWAYENIFRSKFNLAFFQPKKDQSDLCMKYSNSSNVDKENMQAEMECHLACKQFSREAKDTAKIKSQINPSFCSAYFDLQQVLITPYSLSSQLYYRHKLATYNLTVFVMGLKVANCYMWHKDVGQRGANNISLCIYKFILKHHQSGIKEFAFFSDNCLGQNKNKAIVAMYLDAVRKLDISIFYYYMEKGHTLIKGDSLHANIKKASKNVNIYSLQTVVYRGSNCKTKQPSLKL